MNYNSLVLELQNYVKRTDAFYIAQIPNIIDKGINRIYSEAKNIGFEITVNNNLTINNPLYAKPVNWKKTVSFRITDNRVNPVTTQLLLPRSYEFCQSYWPQPTLTSTPKFYADYNAYASFYLTPTPDYAYPLQLIYLGVPLFNNQNQTNFLTQRYPNLLLYSCMLEAVIFLKDDQRIQMFEALFNRALQDINNDSKELYSDRGSRRDVT